MTMNSASMDAVNARKKGIIRIPHLRGSLRSSTEYLTVAKRMAAKAAASNGAMAQEAAT